MNEHLGKPIIGPGSQAVSNEDKVDFITLPSGMMTYAQPELPEPEDVTNIEPALTVASQILKHLHEEPTAQNLAIEISNLDTHNKSFIDQLLGEGEVSIQWHGEYESSAQESVLAGVWRIISNSTESGLSDIIEVGRAPTKIMNETFNVCQSILDIENLDIPDSVYNAPPLLTEISDFLNQGDFTEPHIINLSLLPHTKEDINYLADVLGVGNTVILSRGYGNCRISSTLTKNVWWVQYYNSQDTLILNTLEISEIPEVACAAAEDFEDSAERLTEILNLYVKGE